MRSYYQLGIALCDVTAGFALAVIFHRAREKHDPIARAFQNAARGKVVLLCKNFRGRHQRDLVSVFHGNDGGFEGHDGFAGADIALQQAAHGKRFFHVGSDFLQHSLLRARGMEGENLLDGCTYTIVQPERNTGLCLLFATF